MTVESTAARKTTRRSSGTKRTASASPSTTKKTSTRAAAGATEPELVQLLTPEGERVQHPDYDIDLSAEELRGLYRDMVLTRRFDSEATSSSARASWACGPRSSGRRPPRSVRAVRCGTTTTSSDLPRARRRLVPGRRPDEPPGHVPRREQRRLGPQQQQFPPVHDRPRLADPARHRLCHGHRQGRRGFRRARVLRRRRLQPGRRQRVVRLLRRLQRPGRVLLPEQPVGDLRAHREADPRPALPARPRLRLPRRPGRRQRRPGLPRGHPLGPGARPPRRGPDADRGLHLPDGRPHHLRRPDPLPPRRGARRGRPRTRSCASGRTWRTRATPTRPSSRSWRRRARPSASRSARSSAPCPYRSTWRCSTTCTRTGTRSSTRSARSSPPTRRPSRTERPSNHGCSEASLAKALNESLRTALETDPKVVVMGLDVGKLGGVFRITDGLQKDFGEDRVVDTPLAESGIVGTAIGPRAARLPAGRGDPVRRLRLPAYDQIVTQLAKMRARSLGAVKVPVVIRIPYGGGIGAVEHHSESPSRSSRTSRASRSSPPPLPPTPTGCSSRRSRATTRSSSSSPSAATGTRASSTPRPSPASCTRPGSPARARTSPWWPTARW